MSMKPDVIEKRGPTPNGGNRALGVFLDRDKKPTIKQLAQFFVVKEFKDNKGVCTILYRIGAGGKLTKINKVML